MNWAAIMVELVPLLSPVEAVRIVELTALYSEPAKLPVALVLAVQFSESRWGVNTDHASPKDHGLMGLRVSASVLPEYRGRERELDDLAVNIRLGVEALVYWRRFHWNECSDRTHPWWSHYQWGNVVKDSASGRRLGRIYRDLLLREKKKAAPLVL